MTGRPTWGSDDPNRVSDEDYDGYDTSGLNHETDPDDERDRLRDEGFFGEAQHGKDYPGSAGDFLEDCLAAAPGSILALMGGLKVRSDEILGGK